MNRRTRATTRTAALLMLFATVPLQALSNDPTAMTTTEMQQAQDLADATAKLKESQAKALEAEKKLLDAQLALDDTKKKAQKAAASSTSADAAADALAAAKLQKELADADKATADARTAAFKAKFGGVPDSGIAGDVTLGDKAGSLETGLLAYWAMDLAAQKIARVVKASLGASNTKAKLLVFPAAQMPNFQTVANFMVQRSAVDKALKNASETAKQALGLPTSEAALESATPAMVGIALESISKLLGFFRTDFKVAGVELTLDDVALVQAVAGQDVGVATFLPSIYNPGTVQGAATLVSGELSQLSKQLNESRALAVDLEQLTTTRVAQAAAADTPSTLKASLEAEIARLRDITERFKAVTKAYDTLLDRLMAPDEATATMLRDFAVWNMLQTDGFLLTLKPLRAGGSNYTAKNLWTFFGKMPFYVAGGVVVSYTLMSGKEGKVLASGVVPVHGGFESVKDVSYRDNWMRPVAP